MWDALKSDGREQDFYLGEFRQGMVTIFQG